MIRILKERKLGIIFSLLLFMGIESIGEVFAIFINSVIESSAKEILNILGVAFVIAYLMIITLCYEYINLRNRYIKLDNDYGTFIAESLGNQN